MTAHVETGPLPESDSREETPREMAKQICRGFIAHDRGDRDTAIEAFAFVDRLQFRHIDRHNVEIAANAFVDALWAKDEIEIYHTAEDGSVDPTALNNADWSSVRQQFRRRAGALNIDQEYATLKTEAWRQHKTGGDYWTPFQQAQLLELRCALQDPSYPEKPSEGQSGPGPEAIRYVLGVELHDLHTTRHWEQAVDAMTPYFEYILTHHERTQ